MRVVVQAFVVVLASMTWSVPAAHATEQQPGDKPAGNQPTGDPMTDDYIKVEVRGTVYHPIDAIGGETTGTAVQTGRTMMDLDLRGNQQLLKKAAELNGRKALVAGRLQVKRGVEIPVRLIVEVERLEAAPEANEKP